MLLTDLPCPWAKDPERSPRTLDAAEPRALPWRGQSMLGNRRRSSIPGINMTTILAKLMPK